MSRPVEPPLVPGADIEVRHDVLIGGDWVASTSEASIDVVDPSVEQVVGRVPDGSGVDVDRAVRAARQAQPAWAALAPARRADHLRALRDAILAGVDDLALLISTEVGTPIDVSRDVQVTDPALMLDSFARAAETLDWQHADANSRISRVPIGVAGVIAPWNYPLYQIVAKVGAALAAGCTVVVKPSELAPLNAYRLAEASIAAGLPPGVINIVMGRGATVGEALVTHPGVDMVSFTGSTRAGRRIAALAADAPKPVLLELGGKSATIVLDDADLADVVPRAVADCFRNAGQTCSARTRLLVPAHMSAEAAEIAAATAQNMPLDLAVKPGRHLGPVISAAQRDRVWSAIRQGVAEGARLIAGGAGAPAGLDRGYFVRPTVFDRVANAMTIARQEIFGPVLCVLTYEDDDDAVRIANDSPYGLSGAVWSATDERAVAIADRLRTGEVYVNGGRFNIDAPFGGVGQSGYGRELGPHGVREFTYLRALHLR